MRRPLFLALSAALLILGSFAAAGSASASTIGATTTCSNSVDDTPGLGLICQVSIVNTFTPSGGTAKVTVRECHGAAGDPQAACSTRTVNLTRPVTTVSQCNYAVNGGGGTLRCSVNVTNTFVGVGADAAGVSVDQCVGSGDGIANACDPFPASTTGATITQCNGSANGGTLVGLTCRATGTRSTSHGVRINQCNNSANGGGSLVICSANIVSRVIVSGTPRPSAGSSSSTPSTVTTGTSVTPALPTGPPSDTVAAAVAHVAGSTGSNPVPGIGIVLLIAISVVSLVRRVRSLD